MAKACLAATVRNFDYDISPRPPLPCCTASGPQPAPAAADKSFYPWITSYRRASVIGPQSFVFPLEMLWPGGLLVRKRKRHDSAEKGYQSENCARWMPPLTLEQTAASYYAHDQREQGIQEQEPTPRVARLRKIYGKARPQRPHDNGDTGGGCSVSLQLPLLTIGDGPAGSNLCCLGRTPSRCVSLSWLRGPTYWRMPNRLFYSRFLPRHTWTELSARPHPEIGHPKTFRAHPRPLWPKLHTNS